MLRIAERSLRLWLSAATPVLLLGLSLVIAAPSSALTIYAYTGNKFDTIDNDTRTPGIPDETYTTSMKITGSITLSAPLAANLSSADISGDLLGYSFNDGRNTLTDSNSTLSIASVSTNGLGNITEWDFHVSDPLPIPFTVGDRAFDIGTSSSPAYAEDLGQISECHLVPKIGGKCTTSADSGFNAYQPGAWQLVPEPSTSLLLGIGLVGLAARRKRLVWSNPGPGRAIEGEAVRRSRSVCSSRCGSPDGLLRA